MTTGEEFFVIASAVAIYPVLKRRFPVLSVAFVGARLMESMFIGVGIIAVLALGTLRLHAGDGDPAAPTVVGQALVVVHDWNFKMGPGVVVPFGDGTILGYMMWKARLLPRFLSIRGLLGGPALLALAQFVPPARFVDKPVMSPWHSDLHARPQSAGIEALIVTGSETEVCVLATVMGGIDLGYRVVLLTDAICSGADETHDAMQRIYQGRFAHSTS